MILAKKVMVSGLIMALFFLSSCKDRGAPTAPTDPTDPTDPTNQTIKGKILYSDGVVYGYTSDMNLNEDGMYPVTNSDGTTIGWIDTGHNVFRHNNVMLGNIPCAATTNDAYDENGFLLGTCTVGISSEAANAGLSAYEIAVLDGFTGTGAEWLASLSPRPTEPVYLCVASDLDTSCVSNQNVYKINGLSFKYGGVVTNDYKDGGLYTRGIISTSSDYISWEVRRMNNNILPLYTIENLWSEGNFTTSDDPIFPAHDDNTETKYRLYSEGGDLVFESSLSEKSTLNITKLGVIEIVNNTNELLITHDKDNQKICFEAEKKVCIEYTMSLTVR